MTLYTIGFTQKSAEQFFTTLISAGVKRVVDVRLNNVSQLAGFTRRDDLRYFLEQIANIDYIHMIDLAPEKQMLKDYRSRQMSWDDYVTAYTHLLRTRPGASAGIENLRDGDCLLCSEAEPHRCHRRLVAEMAQHDNHGLEVVHLPL